MTGQPLRRKFTRQVKDQGGDRVILDRIAAGHRMNDIARDYGLESSTCLYQWLHESPEREEAWKEARKRSSYARMEEGLETLENGGRTPDTAAEAAWIRDRANYLKGMAQVYNRELSDADPKVADAVSSLADTWRGMLESINRPPPLPPAEDAEYEILDDPARIEGSDDAEE